MKLYYFMIIAIGLMYTLSLAGVDTASSRVLDSLTSENLTDTDVNPSVSDYSDVTDSSSILNYLTQNWWVIMAIVLALGIFASSIEGIRVFGSGVEINPMNAIISGVAAAIWFMFAVDFFSILVLMREVTGGTGWEFHLTWILVVPFLFGFGYSLIKFMQGTE